MKLALGPMMLKKIGSPDIQRFYSKVLLYTSYVLMFSVIGLSLFSFEIIKVIAKSKLFWEAVAIIPILSFSIIFVNLKDITVYGLHVAKKSRIIGLIVVFATIVSFGLNLLLIPVWDITGAALATLLSQFIFWLLVHHYSQKAFYVPYEITKIILMLFTGAVLSFSCLLLNGMDVIPRLIVKTGCLISFPFILYLLKFYEPVELMYIKGFISKWSKIKNFHSNIQSIKGISDNR
jgi:O-antigen/teichoic acid export membrane protein